MPNTFYVPDDDDEDDFSSPATPLGGGSRGNLFRFDGGASTTPGGLPPPSSAGSFTPAGAPSDSYLGSSMMRGVTATGKSTTSASTPTARTIFGASNAGSGGSSRSGFKAGGSNAPLGRSIQGSKPSFGLGSTRQPSRLSQVMVDDDDDEEEEVEEEEEEEEEEEGEEEGDNEEDAEGEDDDFYPPQKTAPAANRRYGDDEEDDEEEEEEGQEDAENEDVDEEEDNQGGDHDPWLNIAQSDRAPWMPAGGYDYNGEDDMDIAGANGSSDHSSNLLMFATPAANERIRKEAEDIFRASVARSGGVVAGRASVRAPRECRYASIAKSMYNQMGYAPVVEDPELIRQTEVQISQLYSQGVGAEDDPDRLDQALADASGQLVALWQAYVDSLPKSSQQQYGDDNNDEEQLASIGPGPNASAFENAAYVANLALQLHHTRSASSTAGGGIDGLSPPSEPLTETMFRWLADYHNAYPDQVSDVLSYRPGPASHGLFWQTVFVSLLQGRVSDAIELLRAGGWDTVRRAGIPAYTGRALANVERAVQETIGMLETCPGKVGNWDIWNSEWTLFRIRVKGALDHLRRFAEGGRGGASSSYDTMGGDEDADGEDEFGQSLRGRHSMTGMARKAESQVPWDIYENLNIVFDIALGSRERILNVSQDWCEATLGLFGWWDEAKVTPSSGTNAGNFRHSKSLSMSLAGQRNDLAFSGEASSPFEGYLDRLARCFRATTDSGLEINTNSPLEVALACIFEDNPRGLIGLIRSWSLPVASAVVEIASLGGWLPNQSSSSALIATMGDLDMEDLEVLGVDPTDPDESDGLKDNTLVQYAQALVNDKDLATSKGRDEQDESDEDVGSAASSPANMDGWELAIHVLGRMNSQERAEDTIGELVRTILKMLDVDSGATIDKIWRLLSDLGMSSFAEEATEHYGDLLTSESYRFGEAVWYYALAHRPAKVREVMNLLMSYSLIQSAAYPAEADLDEHLRKLLFARRATLEQLAHRDLDAAELLGRLLSGYATLRHFYDVRDDTSINVSLARRRTAAAAALTAVISSADDNIRGGLYDATRDTVVSEDFLLALLGEALVFTEDSSSASSTNCGVVTLASLVTAPPVVAAETVDVLLKAVEDLQTLAGSRVFTACDEFFQVVLASAPGGLKGSTPADLLRKTTSNLSAASSSSYVLSGSSMLASQLHRSMSATGGVNSISAASRGWDWRSGIAANTTAADVLQRVRHGLSRALARLWVAEADEMVGLPGLGQDGSLVLGRS